MFANKMIALEQVTRSRFLRFALVGTAGFVVNEAALWLALHMLSLGPYLGGIFSFLIAATFTWWGNRIVTFRACAAATPHSMLREWLKFVAANGIGFLVNYAVYASLISLAPRPFNNPYLALGFGTLAGLVFNFTLSSKLVFRSTTPT